MKTNLMGGSLLLFSALLTACGGGGGGGDGGSTPGDAQGAYEGTTSNGLAFQSLVLDDDRYYTVYGEPFGDSFILEGFIQGSGEADNGRFRSSNLRDYYFDGKVTPGSLSATYTPGVSFNGSTSSGSETVTFTGTAIPSTEFDYNAAANLSNIVGAWTMTSLQGDTIALTIQSSGAFSATTDGGCSFSGNIAPRASGKNVFDMNLTFGAAPCALPGQSGSGIAVESSNGVQRQLVFAGTSPDREFGTAMLGVR